MEVRAAIRWGGIVCLITAILIAAGGILAAFSPSGGLDGPLVPFLYYLGTVFAVPSLVALFAARSRQYGSLGLVGFVLSILGAVLYSGPQLALLAGTSGAVGWHDVWGFAMGNVLLIGPIAFFVGMILMGWAAGRMDLWSGWPSRLLAIGALIWLVAYFLSVVPGLLTLASVITAAGLGWMGLLLWFRSAQTAEHSALAS